MMEAEFNHLNHATWECKYHVVFTPKYRKKLLFGKIKRHLGQVFHDLARRKECRIEEGHLMPDHVHMLISIPPKYSVAQIIGYMRHASCRTVWSATQSRSCGSSTVHAGGLGVLRRVSAPPRLDTRVLAGA